MVETAGLGTTLVGSCARGDKDGSSLNNDDEENCALTTKSRRGKGKKSPSKSEAKGKKLDFSKVKCFHCHEHGNLATNYS